ncbi:hypothetical protein FFLO_06188 [Filobasidium floriforme]|uniref:Amine oxidase domain-containing protein n=1 Tax=Filobasidium floriforme TaxID=5210 RepID=A0A8K0JFF1_9TREE|nr:flavin-containing amine oxidoreductase-domain containing protein [Filobasidium floriforme]KAG7528397.1 hypothetical protein FFLO_06188 [Filobasidium floriforme]KAH8086791.1 flavin-containing amine oxidoreductase-domain containing protein [Filobasidium floriforme]
MKDSILISLLPLLLAGSSAVQASPAPKPSIEFLNNGQVHRNGAHNIHVSYDRPEALSGDVILVYGDCGLDHHSKSHHEVGRFSSDNYKRDGMPTRFVWLTPEDAPSGGCLHAFTDAGLVGQSAPLDMQHAPFGKRNTLSSINDPYGAWFDGVAYLKAKEPEASFVAGKKDQKIGIIGGGMSGLMSALLLDSVGIHNWEISESSQRIGGRLHTAYLNGTKPEDYQYQEMGPMRFPTSLTYTGTNETLEIQDHKLVFQLADELNKMNKGGDPSLQVNFIPWIQNNPNTYQYVGGLRNPDGTAPRRSQYAALAANASAGTEAAEPNAAVEAAEEHLEEFIGYQDRYALSAANIFKAHKAGIEGGLMDFSESMFLRSQGLGWNETSAVGGTGTLWDEIYDGVYFSATTWKTIDKGLNRLAEAFHPIVDKKITYGRRVNKLSYDESTKKTSVHWYDNAKSSSETLTYDKTIVAVPFSVARLWRLPKFNPVMTEAITGLGYSYACKVALLYKTRFWEQIEDPIFGGCGSTDLPGIGSVCYPAYNINGTGPGAMLASYTTPVGPSLSAMSEADHVGMVVEAMNEIHGDIAREQYTGEYDRVCWGLDPHQAGSWASPYTGQHERYMPEYHKTHSNHIFVGEHTSVNHAWIFSALESATRGVVQLLLEDGLVDEAKEIVNKWMARWISV